MKNNKFTKDDIEKNNKFAIISYICAPVVYYSKRKSKSKWLQYHARQGMDLFLAELIYILVSIILLLEVKVPIDCTNYTYGIKLTCGVQTPDILKVILVVFGVLLLICNIWGIILVKSKEAGKIPMIGELNLFK